MPIPKDAELALRTRLLPAKVMVAKLLNPKAVLSTHPKLNRKLTSRVPVKGRDGTTHVSLPKPVGSTCATPQFSLVGWTPPQAPALCFLFLHPMWARTFSNSITSEGQQWGMEARLRPGHLIRILFYLLHKIKRGQSWLLMDIFGQKPPFGVKNV